MSAPVPKPTTPVVAIPTMKYLNGYPASLIAQARGLMERGELGPLLAKRYPEPHEIRSDKALFDYVQDFKQRHLRNESPIARVAYDAKLKVLQHALGTHTRSYQQQGNRLKSRREIRIATLFRDAPAEFLKMIVVHELAHLKEPEHDKAFYQLCHHMASDYAQLEFDLRLWLCVQDAEAAAAKARDRAASAGTVLSIEDGAGAPLAPEND